MRAARLLGLIAITGLLLSALSAEADSSIRQPAMPDSQLVRSVSPAYPAVALRNHIQGTVKFAVIVDKDGRIESLRLISGHPLLRDAARRAAEQWIYRPTLRAGKPVRVISTLEVRFQLDERGEPVQGGHQASPRL